MGAAGVKLKKPLHTHTDLRRVRAGNVTFSRTVPQFTELPISASPGDAAADDGNPASGPIDPSSA